MGSTGDSPVPVGDPPTGMGKANCWKFMIISPGVCLTLQSDQWPDGRAGRPYHSSAMKYPGQNLFFP